MQILSLLAASELLPSVLWLLGKQTPTYGWTYRQTEGEDEAFATAACIAALAVYLTKCEKTSAAVDAIKRAVSSALDRLFGMLSVDGFWRGHLNESNDLSGTANIVDLISFPEVRSALKKALIRARRGHGWPVSYNDVEPALNSTIQVLSTIYDVLLSGRGDIDHESIKAIVGYIADEMLTKDGGQRLDSRDWPMLARLCALILSNTEGRILPESEIQRTDQLV